jgi:hypothetical protein
VTEQDVYDTAGQVLMRYNGSGGWLSVEARGCIELILRNTPTRRDRDVLQFVSP